MNHNPYSEHWFRTFCETVPADWTLRDVEGLRVLLPLPQFLDVLDIGCGIGRVAGPLALHGYNVTGIDSSGEAIAIARRSQPDVNFIELDQADLDELPPAVFDCCLVLWHSLGYSSDKENGQVLKAIRRRLRIGGLAIFDLFNPEFAKNHAGKAKSRGLDVVTAETVIRGDRLLSVIDYLDGHQDRIEFQIYDTTTFMQLCHASGFKVIEILTEWKSVDEVGPEHVRYQVVCEAVEA